MKYVPNKRSPSKMEHNENNYIGKPIKKRCLTHWGLFGRN